jgi:biopolymer transport protein ExbD
LIALAFMMVGTLASFACTKRAPLAPPTEPIAVLPEPAPDLRLPGAAGHHLNRGSAVEVRLTRTAILVGPNKIWDLPPHDQVQQTGAGVGAKRAGPNDLYLVPLAAALAKEGQAADTVVIYADVETPFRLLLEVLLTCEQVNLKRYLLVTGARQGDRSGELRGFETTPPKLKPPSKNGRSAAYLVMLVTEGLDIKFEGGNVAPGCGEHGYGLTLPSGAGRYDLVALQACLRRLKARVADSPDDQDLDQRWIHITPAPAVRYQDIISTMQALQDIEIDTVDFQMSL